MKLTRDRSTGQIKNGNQYVNLIGGSFHPFFKDPDVAAIRPFRRVVDTASHPIARSYPQTVGPDPDNCTPRFNAGCPPAAIDPASYETWAWSDAFASLSGRGINLVRTFATNGVAFRAPNTKPLDVYPFVRDAGTNKLKVEQAVTQGIWNEDYFSVHLRPFVQTADANGVAVQFCLFIRHDLTDVDTPYFKYWPLSPWNANATLPDGSAYLIPGSTVGQVPRTTLFCDTSQRILQVQLAFLRKVLATLCPLGNVIFELMNEPTIRPDDTPKLSAWYDCLVSTIVGFAPPWRPLISVNPAHPVRPGITDDDPYDVDDWLTRYSASFDQVDLLSHHGLSGFNPFSFRPCCSYRDDGVTPRNELFSRVDPAAIASRIERHFRPAAGKVGHPTKALLFSTDAVSHPTHTFSFIDRAGDTLELEKRDGQIVTSLGNATGNLETQLTESDLGNWAFWVLDKAGAESPGRVHFQNHSLLEPSFDQIGMATARARRQGQVAAPPLSGAGWKGWALVSEPSARQGKNFTWALRQIPADGSSVTQLGTVPAPEWPRAGARAESGFRLDLTASASGWCCFNLDYVPVSVSIRSQGALVAPSVFARVAEVAADGQPGTVLGSADILLSSTAAGGELDLCATVVTGRRYALIFGGAVEIDYRNNYQGYGETIARFPSVRKVMPGQ